MCDKTLLKKKTIPRLWIYYWLYLTTSAAGFLKGKDSNAQFQPRVVRKNASKCGRVMGFSPSEQRCTNGVSFPHLCLQAANGNLSPWMSVNTISARRDPSCWLACLSTSNGPTMAQNHVYLPTLRRKNSSDLTTHISWLVALTILKNISQWEGLSMIIWLSHILWKIKFMFETTNQYHIYVWYMCFYIYLVVQCK